MRFAPRHLLLILIAATGSAACAAPARTPAGGVRPTVPVDWRSLVGCYRAGDQRFALDSVPFLAVHSIEAGSRQARSADEWWRRYDTYWRMTAPDSVKLVWDAGLYGGSFHFAVYGDTLVGREGGYTDVPPYRYRPRR